MIYLCWFDDSIAFFVKRFTFSDVHHFFFAKFLLFWFRKHLNRKIICWLAANRPSLIVCEKVKTQQKRELQERIRVFQNVQQILLWSNKLRDSPISHCYTKCEIGNYGEMWTNCEIEIFWGKFAFKLLFFFTVFIIIIVIFINWYIWGQNESKITTIKQNTLTQ